MVDNISVEYDENLSEVKKGIILQRKNRWNITLESLEELEYSSPMEILDDKQVKITQLEEKNKNMLQGNTNRKDQEEESKAFRACRQA